MSEFVFTMGLPAAGKSTTAAAMFSETHTFIDPDAIKATHPEYNPRDCQNVHEWSMQEAEKQFVSAISSGKGNWLIDGTGTNAEMMVRRIAIAQNAGFYTKLVYVTCSLETSLRRAAARERQVPEFVIREKSLVISTSFEIVRQYVDEVVVVDNNEDR